VLTLLPEHILFEDPFILVVNKPAGLMVEPDRNNFPNLKNFVFQYLKMKNEKSTEIYAQHIHRLDRPVSGCVLFAKQKSVLKNLSEQFAERKVKKSYIALSENFPEAVSATLEQWHRKEKKKAVISKEGLIGAEKIRLTYNTKTLSPNRCFWEIGLHTGKFHQIRIQLAHIGCPIIGDELYGSTADLSPNKIALHAESLEFKHPINEESLKITAPRPDYFNTTI